MSTRFHGSLLVIAALSIALHVPALSIPLLDDSLNSVSEAAVSLRDPSYLLRPWMGGTLRIVPKLAFMGGVLAWGGLPWAYRLLNLLVHAFCTVLVGRLGRRWTGSASFGLRAALLFGLGVGAYAKGVIQVSNLTMLLGLAFLLLSLDFFWSRRYVGAGVFFALAAASHEIVLLAPVLVPVLVTLRSSQDRSPGEDLVAGAPTARWTGKAVAALLVAFVIVSLLPGAPGAFGRVEVGLSAFMLLPLNVQGAAAWTGRAGGFLATVGAIAAESRYVVGLVITLVLAAFVFKAKAFLSYCVAWVYVFFVPSAFLMASWGGGWLERRYLYIPAVGACLLLSAALGRIDGRRRVVATVAFSLLIAWGVATSAFVMHRHRQISETPTEVARRAQFREEMRALGR